MRAELVKILEGMGYRYYGADSIRGSDGVTYACKAVPDTKRHQIIVKEWDLNHHGHTFFSYEVEMVFETKNETWASIKFYSLGETEMLTQLSDLEERLYAAAISMGANSDHYRYDGEN